MGSIEIAMTNRYAIGLDFGTNTVRALLVDVATGDEAATSVFGYPHGTNGVVTDASDPDLARHHPADYLEGVTATVRDVLAQAAAERESFSPSHVVGIGVDTTGSTPLPVDETGRALAMKDGFRDNPHAMAWLWKDHTGHAEAEAITARAEEVRPQFLARCGGRYSSEWFWAKIWRCARVAPEVFEQAHTWVEVADWVPAVLTGHEDPRAMKRGICAAGHKAMFHPDWGGYPDAEFLASLDPSLATVRETLPDRAFNVSDAAGGLSGEWADRLGLPAGTSVAVGAFDAHLGAIGSGVAPGVMVKIIGTSTCDITVSPMDGTDGSLPDIPGLCGIVPESVLPESYGLEAGQSAVGDIFNWFVEVVRPGGVDGSHEALTRAAEALRPGESGLLALDWHNGNRTVLVDQRLTGLILGLTLHSTPAEIYRALIEATAFGARTIAERFAEYGVPIERVINCGGIAAKNPLVMRIYADVLNRPMQVSRSNQTCALGAAMAGSVVAGKERGGHAGFREAAEAMTGLGEVEYAPDPDRAAAYDRLFRLYHDLHDAFGVSGHRSDISHVMKELLDIRDEARREGSP